jgi:hypothetical protein
LTKRKTLVQKERRRLFSFPRPSLLFFFWGYATNPLSAKKPWCEKRAKKMKGIYTSHNKKNSLAKNNLDVQNGAKWT